MNWDVIGVVGVVLTGVGVLFQILSWNNDRKLLKRNNPPSQEGKTDSFMG
ncbi:hypothetical protein ACT8ZR_15715 [Neobacillus sp. M.A.Huq-85]